MKSQLLLISFACSILCAQAQNYHYLTYSLRSMGLANKPLTENSRFDQAQISSQRLRPGLVIGAGIGQHLENSSTSIQLELGLSYNRFSNDLTRYLAFRQESFVDRFTYRRNYSSYQLELSPSFVHQIGQSLFEFRWGFRIGFQFYQFGRQDRLQQRFFLESPGTQLGSPLSDVFIIQSTFADWQSDTYGWFEFGTKYWLPNKKNAALEIFGSISPSILGVKGKEYSYLFGVNFIQQWDRPSKK